MSIRRAYRSPLSQNYVEKLRSELETAEIAARRWAPPNTAPTRLIFTSAPEKICAICLESLFARDEASATDPNSSWAVCSTWVTEHEAENKAWAIKKIHHPQYDQEIITDDVFATSNCSTPHMFHVRCVYQQIKASEPKCSICCVEFSPQDIKSINTSTYARKRTYVQDLDSGEMEVVYLT